MPNPSPHCKLNHQISRSAEKSDKQENKAGRSLKFKNLRRHIGRVSRWRKDSKQADLWLALGLSLAQRGFRKIKGHSKLPELVRALSIKKKSS